MKVWIEKADTPVEKLGGKSLFTRRLADEFRLRDIEVVSEGKADVSLNVIRLKHEESKVKVLRLDGVWHDTGKDWQRKNIRMAQSVKRADGVVYQSNFSRRMCEKYLGEPKTARVIFNGTSPEVYDNIKPANFDADHVFLACSKWRPHKRLRDILESFLLAGLKDSHLMIVGDGSASGIPKDEAEKYFKEPNIDYLGPLPQNMLMPILKGCTGSIHLCWFDACPNSVVEAIVAGVPVITNNVGGTWEIVGPSNGYVCMIDEPYDFEPVDLYHPPPIDQTRVAEAIIQCALERPKIMREHVLISHAAHQYLTFMEELCSR